MSPAVTGFVLTNQVFSATLVDDIDDEDDGGVDEGLVVFVITICLLLFVCFCFALWYCLPRYHKERDEKATFDEEQKEPQQDKLSIEEAYTGIKNQNANGVMHARHQSHDVMIKREGAELVRNTSINPTIHDRTNSNYTVSINDETYEIDYAGGFK